MSSKHGIAKLRPLWDRVMRALESPKVRLVAPPAPARNLRWVRTEDCRILVFEADYSIPEAFRLINAAGEAWDGGKGASDAWEFLDTGDITPEVQARYSWLKPAKRRT